MNKLTILTAAFFLPVLSISGDELSGKALVMQVLEARESFESNRDRLDKLVGDHNQSEPDWTVGYPKKLREAFAEIQQPFRAKVLELASKVEAGSRIQDFPGILALGCIAFDPESEIYELVIDWGYGDYEGSWRLLPRSFSFWFDASGKFIRQYESPVPETE